MEALRLLGEIRKILGTVQNFPHRPTCWPNAAIEAARAGEQGWLAAVADEVRSLSIQVGAAADQIGELMEQMFGAVSGAEQRAPRDAATSGKRGRGAMQRISSARWSATSSSATTTC